MRIVTCTLVALLITSGIFAQHQFKTVKVSENLEIVKLSPHSYVHVSYSEPNSTWGRIASNGLVFVQGGEAFLFDTPMDEPTTIQLVNFIKDSLKAQIKGFVPNHWHEDCIGGLAYLHQVGVKSYANYMTIELAQKKGYTVPKNAFKDSLQLKLGKEKIFCYYPGAAHSLDNIVVWIPAENILFAGCMAKEMKSRTMGNYVDGDLKAWPGTIERVINRFPSAKIVIPGHGQFGDLGLLTHTLELARSQQVQ